MKKLTFILSLILSFNTYGEIVTGDPCGTNCHWNFDTDSGKLTITGGQDGAVGTMDNFTYSSDETTTQPWNQYKNSITSVDISGVENVGDDAFVFARNLSHVNFDSSVKKIGDAAFNTTSLQSVILPDSLEILGNFVFENAPLQSVTIPDTLQALPLEGYAFSRVLEIIENLEIICKGQNCDTVKDALKGYLYYNDNNDTWETTNILSDNLKKAGEKQCNSSDYYWNGQTCANKKTASLVSVIIGKPANFAIAASTRLMKPIVSPAPKTVSLSNIADFYLCITL